MGPGISRLPKQEFCNSGDIVAVRVVENGEGYAILKKVKILNNGSIIFTNGLNPSRVTTT